MLSLVKEIMNMKKLNVALAILVTAVMAGNAQTNVTVTSDVVGYQTTTLPAGSYKGVGISLVNPAVVSGSIATSASGLLTISGASAIGSTLDAASAYYVEITSGANVGDRFDVNVAATKSANNATVQLASSSTRNTASSTVNLAGQSLVMRKHVTFDQFRQSLTGTLTGNDDTASQADTLYVHNGIAFDIYWLGADKQSWFTSADPDDHRDTIIAPGQGVLFYKRGTAATFTSVGNVRNNNYKQVIPSGYKMCAPGFPRSYTPVTAGASLNQGWSVNDRIYVHNGTAFSLYTLTSDGSAQGAWDNGIDPDPVNDTQIVQGDTAFLTKLNTASASIETKP
jgi:hypothetical protein